MMHEFIYKVLNQPNVDDAVELEEALERNSKLCYGYDHRLVYDCGI